MPKEMEIELIAEKAVNYIKYKLREEKVTDFEYKMILSKMNILLSIEVYGLIKTDYDEFLQTITASLFNIGVKSYSNVTFYFTLSLDFKSLKF